MTYHEGDRVTITYTGYETEAVVLNHDEPRGWVKVRELSDRWPETEGPEYEAAVEYVRPHGTPRTRRTPFEDMAEAFRGLVGGS